MLKKQEDRDWGTMKLTDREDQVLRLIMDGLSNKEIADRLDISPHTTKFHVRNACGKMGTRSRVKAAVTFALMQASSALGRLSLIEPTSVASEVCG